MNEQELIIRLMLKTGFIYENTINHITWKYFDEN